MLDDGYLAKGIIGLTRAADYSWEQGHFPCGVIGAYFLCRDNALGSDSLEGIRSELDKMVEAHGHLFEPMSITNRQTSEVTRLTQALATNITKRCPGGHNVIYAALGLKALETLPEMIGLETIRGIRKLIVTFTEMSEEAEYQDIDLSQVDLEPADDIPEYANVNSIAEFTFSELLSYQPMYYELQGRVGHVLTHAQSLVELERLGHLDLAQRGHLAHRRHAMLVRLNKRLDQSDWTEVDPAAADPLSPSFWEHDLGRMKQSHWGYSHFFKFRYHFLDLLKYVKDSALRTRIEQRLPEYLMNETARIGQVFESS